MKRKILLLTVLMLTIAAGVWVMQPKDAVASIKQTNPPCNPPCTTICGCAFYSWNNDMDYNVQLTHVFPSPCPDKVYDFPGEGPGGPGGQYVPCSSGDCGNHCSLGINLGAPYGVINLSSIGSTTTWNNIPNANCPTGFMKITYTPNIAVCCDGGHILFECE